MVTSEGVRNTGQGRSAIEVESGDEMMRGGVSLPHGFGHASPGIRLDSL